MIHQSFDRYINKTCSQESVGVGSSTDQHVMATCPNSYSLQVPTISKSSKFSSFFPLSSFFILLFIFSFRLSLFCFLLSLFPCFSSCFFCKWILLVFPILMEATRLATWPRHFGHAALSTDVMMPVDLRARRALFSSYHGATKMDDVCHLPHRTISMIGHFLHPFHIANDLW